MKKGIIFDMDGTLIQTELILEEALNHTLRELDSNGIKYVDNPIEKYQEIMGVALNVVWRRLLLKPSDEHVYMVNNHFQNALISCILSGKSSLYNGAEEALKDIKNKGYSIYIASNGDQKYLSAIYEKHGLQKYFSGVYSINEIETDNKADLVKYIMEKETVLPEFIIGDRLSDFMAGKSNNIKAIGCKFYFSKEAELLEANYVVDSLSELREIIK
jgi:phosphoglycolate phosphatase